MAGQTTLEKLLESDKITFLQWLNEAMPGVVPGRQNLIDAEELLVKQAGQAQQPVDLETFRASLSPEEQQQFDAMTPEQQQSILQGVQNEVPTVQ